MREERAEIESPTRANEVLGVQFTPRRVLGAVLFVGLSIAFLYFVLPKLVGLRDTWNRLQRGDVWWFGVAGVLEGLSFASYIALFRVVFVRGAARISWRVSYQITMAGVAATRLLASAGAGGVAVTVWALTRAGMRPRLVASRMVAFMALLYGVYMATLVIVGLGLYLGLFPGPAPFAITVVPAIFGATVIALFLGISAIPWDLEALVRRRTKAESRVGRIALAAAAAPAALRAGVRDAIELVKTRNPLLLGALGWWAFDISVLWASFHAFGSAPPQAVIVMAYFVGMLGNVLPLPGGIGGVDGGMIGAFTAFGVDVELSIVAVLAYRAFAFWIPTIPGAVAFLQLRRTIQGWRRSEARPPAEPPAVARSYT
ncbi:MAG: YbhN family protein [Solirubrobacteraceae bacterium]